MPSAASEQQVTSKQYQRHQRKQPLRCIGQPSNRRFVVTHDGCWWFLEGLTDFIRLKRPHRRGCTEATKVGTYSVLIDQRLIWITQQRGKVAATPIPLVIAEATEV